MDERLFSCYLNDQILEINFRNLDLRDNLIFLLSDVGRENANEFAFGIQPVVKRPIGFSAAAQKLFIRSDSDLILYLLDRFRD